MQIIQRTAQGECQFKQPLSPLLQRIYAHRGLLDDEAIEHSIQSLIPISALTGTQQGSVLLAQALQAQKNIVVVGDFDADGATATAVIVRALRMFGFQQLDFYVPDRLTQGYGLSDSVVKALLLRGVEVIITVDNGITAHQAIALAKQQGVDVIVTDHHLPAEQLPEADVIINPNSGVCDFPSKAMAGVGVAFYFMLSLKQHLHKQGLLTENVSLTRLLDLVALGTVADVVPLDKNNRIMVQQGINQMRQGHANEGIKALFKVANKDISHASSGDLGFVCGPRLNAAGRLQSMSLGIACLLTDDSHVALEMAHELNDINMQRRDIEGDMKEQALAQVEEVETMLNGEALPSALCLYNPSWHQGVIGIVASRIKDRYHRPCMVFADDEDERYLKGSCRSVKGVHIRDFLQSIDASHPHLIKSYGGHAMAAGLTVPKASFVEWVDLVHQRAEEYIDRSLLNQAIEVDGGLADEERSLANARVLRDAMPWGQAMPEPVFVDRFKVLAVEVLKQAHARMHVCSVETEHDRHAQHYTMMWFNYQPNELPQIHHTMTFVYQLKVNAFRGNETAQLICLGMLDADDDKQ